MFSLDPLSHLGRHSLWHRFHKRLQCNNMYFCCVAFVFPPTSWIDDLQHRFSMGFRSGLCGGQSIPEALFGARWILVLSSWNMPAPSGKTKSIDWITWSPDSHYSMGGSSLFASLIPGDDLFLDRRWTIKISMAQSLFHMLDDVTESPKCKRPWAVFHLSSWWFLHLEINSSSWVFFYSRDSLLRKHLRGLHLICDEIKRESSAP